MGRAFLGGTIGLLAGLVLGCAGGFFLGVWSTDAGKRAIEDVFTTEKPADVKSPKRISRPGFELEYPGNWKVDEADEDYDPDHLFSLESPGSCFVQLAILDVDTDPASNVDVQVEALVPKLIKNPKRTAVTSWGAYRGEGVLLEGKIMAINDGSIRVFSHSTGERSFTITEMCFAEDDRHVEPGFELVRNTFRLKRSG